MKNVLGGSAPVVPKCKKLGTACSSNDDCGGANNYCYCRLNGVGCM